MLPNICNVRHLIIYGKYRKSVEYFMALTNICYTEDNAYSSASLFVSTFFCLHFSLCFKLTVIYFFFCSPFCLLHLFLFSLSLCVCASLSSDGSCWAFLLSHEVSSYGNPFITDTQTCTHTWTLFLFACHPV